MNYEDVKDRLAPCGLSCEKCFAFKDGKIKFHSEQLRKHLGNFENYARRFVELLNEPSFKTYPEFKNLLDLFAAVECQGCRKETCKLFSGCRVRECSTERRADFCFQCAEFPCMKTGFDENLHARSVRINSRMKETGVEAFYDETRDKPRY